MCYEIEQAQSYIRSQERMGESVEEETPTCFDCGAPLATDGVCEECSMYDWEGNLISEEDKRVSVLTGKK